ncbi:hypothetical protein GF327_05775 [Candidatus Woesearchaeota archaeon]|nr:hypothetical protein [Candidatus Woesearchaeota archaeon]
MDNNKARVRKIIIKLGKEQGEVIPISEIVLLAEEIDEKIVMETIDELEQDGFVSYLNKESIELNM